MTDFHVTQDVIEALTTSLPDLRVTQATIELLTSSSLLEPPPTTGQGNVKGKQGNKHIRTDENGSVKVTPVTAGSGTGPLTPFAHVACDTDATGALKMAPITLNPPLGPLTDLANLRVCTDENEALLVAINPAGLLLGPLTNLGNIRARTDARGSLVVASVAAGSLQTPLTPTLNLRGRTDENGALIVTGLAPSSPLLTSLVSYWKLDEASGTRVDSVGTNNLTPTNAPVGAPGKIGNACDFEVDTLQTLSHPDPAPLGDENFTYALWCKRETIGIDVALISKDGPPGRYYYLIINSAGGAGFTLHPGAAAVSTGVVANDTNWHAVVFWHDAAINTIFIQVDNGTISSSVYSTYTPAVGATPVIFGQDGFGGKYYDGLIDEVGLWRRVLTPAERTTLYNGGAGLTYPFA